MRPFHPRHRWMATNHAYVPPISDNAQIAINGNVGISDRVVMLRRMTFGYTTITYSCWCGRIKSEIHEGEVVPPRSFYEAANVQD